jgi:hypothetical protein
MIASHAAYWLLRWLIGSGINLVGRIARAGPAHGTRSSSHSKILGRAFIAVSLNGQPLFAVHPSLPFWIVDAASQFQPVAVPPRSGA